MEEKKLHVVMIPWLAFGHMIPYLELAKAIAMRGHVVTYISTPHNIERLPPIPPTLSHLINLVPLTPLNTHGLHELPQATSDIPLTQQNLIKKLLDDLELPIETFLKGQGQAPPPDWIIYDLFVYWAPRLARSLGVPCALFSVLSARTLSFIGPPTDLLANATKPGYRSPEQRTKIPPWITIPCKPAYRYHEVAMLFNVPPHGVPEPYRLGTSFQGCNFLAIRTSTDFDADWVRLVATLHQNKPVLPVGFLSPSPPTHEHDSTTSCEEGGWLNTQEEGSTVYIAFGSELRLTKEQVTELAWGLELSQLPFFWAYRGDSALLPAGFVYQTKGRGFVRAGWAPQAKFLAHPSVGVFLMHGGWGSAIEGLSFGKPLVMLPMLGDQGPNTRVMEEMNVGVEVWPRNETDGAFTRDAVAKALRLVAVEREGECIRASAREMQNMFGNKVRHGQHIDEFVHYLIEHRREKKRLN